MQNSNRETKEHNGISNSASYSTTDILHGLSKIALFFSGLSDLLLVNYMTTNSRFSVEIGLEQVNFTLKTEGILRLGGACYKDKLRLKRK